VEGRKLTFIPALDGVRAIAIVLVVLHHTFRQFEGGRSGVDVFFVLSGFLISSLIVNEFDSTRAVSLKNFYKRRAYRLFPAAAALLVVVVAYATVTEAAHGKGIPGSVYESALFAVLYITNWGWAFGAHLAAPLVHLWSLAVEEQFYLLAPIAFALALPRWSRQTVIRGLLVIGVIGVAWRAVLFAQDASLSRLRFGLDVHADGLIVGCMLGVAFASGLAPRLFAGAAGKEWIGVAAVVGLGALSLNWYATWSGLEAWGPTLWAAVSALLLCSVVGQTTGLHVRFLGLAPMRRVGKVSYALYLWHLPVLYYGFRALGPGTSMWVSVPICWAISYAFAEASFRFVETTAHRIRDQRARRYQSVGA
jgi:peptidoglycan/LPS O-acetylase OafA/YrhL